MIRSAASLLVVGCLLTAAAFADPAQQPAEPSLNGQWTAVEYVGDGHPISGEMLAQMSLNILGNQMIPTNQPQEAATFRTDSSHAPAWLDITAPTGELIQGIYKLDGDELTLCVTMPGRGRPNDFVSTPGSERVLIVLTRDAMRPTSGPTSAPSTQPTTQPGQ